MEQQSRSKAPWVAVAVLVVVALGATVYALNIGDDSSTVEQTAKNDSTSASNEAETQTPQQTDAVTGSTVIVFTNNGFEKSSYTSKEGEAVTVRNDSNMDLEFSSDDHPTHHNNPKMNMDVMGAGESGTFTTSGKGTYGFHDHINDQYQGTLTVE